MYLHLGPVCARLLLHRPRRSAGACGYAAIPAGHLARWGLWWAGSGCAAVLVQKQQRARKDHPDTAWHSLGLCGLSSIRRLHPPKASPSHQRVLFAHLHQPPWRQTRCPPAQTHPPARQRPRGVRFLHRFPATAAHQGQGQRAPPVPAGRRKGVRHHTPPYPARRIVTWRGASALKGGAGFRPILACQTGCSRGRWPVPAR